MKKTTRRPQPEEIKETWYLLDAKGQVLGRLASQIAGILMGKNTPSFDPAVANNAKIVVINAAQIKVTGDKLTQKEYHRHSGYPGGLKTITLSRLMASQPAEVIRKAVSGMLPKNKLRSGRLDNLRIYKDEQHPHQAQQPKIITNQ